MKLISISGSGRSGSTFLAVLLTQNDDVFNLGQTRDFWRAYSDNAVCSCGETLTSCLFWSRVTRIAFGGSPRPVLFDTQQLMAAFQADAKAIADWTDGDALARLANTHESYLDRLGAFLSAAKEVAQVDSFLDMSKSPEIALAFSLVKGIDLRVINLVRDPRAVACSWEKKKGLQAAIWYTRDWAWRQRILARWSLALGERFVQVRYEDITLAPRLMIKQLLDRVGLRPSPDLFTSDHGAEVSWDRQHLFPPANETVLAEKRTGMNVVLAREWRKPENHPILRMVETNIGELMTQFGYQRLFGR